MKLVVNVNKLNDKGQIFAIKQQLDLIINKFRRFFSISYSFIHSIIHLFETIILDVATIL